MDLTSDEDAVAGRSTDDDSELENDPTYTETRCGYSKGGEGVAYVHRGALVFRGSCEKETVSDNNSLCPPSLSLFPPPL